MKLIACDPLVGLPRMPEGQFIPDVEDLLAEMQRLGVEAALVRHRTAADSGPIVGNRNLARDIAGRDGLLACELVTPDGEEPDFDPAAAIDRMIARGARACWADGRAEAEDFSLLPWCSGPLYEVLQSRCLPLLLDYKSTTADDLDVILSDFVRLRLILLGAPRLGRNRRIYPLLRRHRNLMLCLSHTYSVHRGVEDLCETFGRERWVFGTGYPAAEGGAAVAGLMYAGIGEDDRQAIAHRNIERLMEEIR